MEIQSIRSTKESKNEAIIFKKWKLQLHFVIKRHQFNDL